MSYSIKIASSKEDKEAIFRFRYKVYMEELNKRHIAADHDHKMLFDEADKYTILYYAANGNDVIGTVRSQRGTEGMFLANDKIFFGIDVFDAHIDCCEMAIVDRLIVDQEYRHGSLAHELMLATYLGGLEVGTRICFITCDEKLLQMYQRYGFRVYATPVFLSSGEKRYRMVLMLCDRNHLQKVRSPFLRHLPESLDDGGECASIIERELGFKLVDEFTEAA